MWPRGAGAPCLLFQVVVNKIQHHAERTRNTCAGREFGSRITKLRRPRHVKFSPVIRSSTWYGSEAPIPKFSIGTQACPLWELYGSRVTRTRMTLSRASVALE